MYLGETQRPMYFDMKTLNPFDFSAGAAWKGTLWTALIFKIVKGFGVKDPLKRVPFLGKYVKMS